MFGEIRIMDTFKGKNFPSPKVTAINKWTMNNSQSSFGGLPEIMSAKKSNYLSRLN